MSQKKQTKTKEVVTTETNNSALSLSEGTDWDFGETSSSDIKIPKVMVVQGTSKFVEEYEQGALILSHASHAEVLADKGGSFKVLPFYTHKIWICYVHDESTDEWRWSRNEARTDANDGWDVPLEWEEQGSQMKKERATNFYCFLDAPALDTIPVLLQFKGTSNKRAKPVSSHFAMSRLERRYPFSHWWEVAGEYIKKPGKAYYEITAKRGEAYSPTKETVAIFAKWAKDMSAFAAGVNPSVSVAEETEVSSDAQKPKYDATSENTAQY